MCNTSKKDNKPTTQCDVCGAKNKKIHRRYRNEGYCINCYKTWFIKKSCAGCGEIARLHKKYKFACCKECFRTQGCQRCGKDAYVNGANTDYGRICQTCYASYFTKKKICFECGVEKSHVSRYKKLNHDNPICLKCYQKHFHATCPCCRRHRELVNTSEGRKCKKCHEIGEIECKSCQKIHPAGYGDECWSCYWSQKLEHESGMNCYLFDSEVIKEKYLDFIAWLEETKGANVACVKHNNYIDFFTTCDMTWDEIPEYKTLVKEFKPAGLREYLTVLHWLIETNKVIVDEQIKLDTAEHSYIETALSIFEEVPEKIDMYYQHLLKKQTEGKITMKTARLALRPVISTYTKYNLKGSEKPNNEQIEGYLIEKSGQYNSFLGFITFLRRECNINLVCARPNKLKVEKFNAKELEQKLIDLTNLPKPFSCKTELDWYQTAMAYFHGINVPRKAFSKNNLKRVDSKNGMVEFEYLDCYYWIPHCTIQK